MGDYHPTDVERVKTDDTYVLWFFQSKGVEEAPDAIDVALKFRKNLCLHGILKYLQIQLICDITPLLLFWLTIILTQRDHV